MKRKTVIVTEYVDPAGLQRLNAETRLIYLPDSPSTPLEAVIGEAHGLGVRLVDITPEVMDAAPSLKVIAKHGVGVDNIDVAAATARRIPVVSTPRANSISVAEHILSLLLSLANRICAADAALKAGRFKSREDYVGVELHEKTFGVVGLGRIGTEVARMAHGGLGMHVCFFDPVVSAERTDVDSYRRASTLDELLQQADFVALCL
ncbi:NAD(P)-dependent oxidoreductase, partial [Chloroflexota bacterium]